ncbi:MAG: ATP-dependent Clp protease ATP-binding subunit ClpX, partial [Burkholderiaceae bacterium]
ARGLRSILEVSLMKTMYEMPDVSNLSKVVVEENVILEEVEPILIYEDKGRVGKRKASKN